MKLIYKELKLATSPLAWLFLAFAFMALIPGYPIALGAFFVCLGQFQSVQLFREANDILYSALLPIPKKDVVTAKYLVVVFFQMIAFCITVLLTLLRLTALKDAAVYVNNALLAANFTFLGCVLVIFALYNTVFLGGFFKTAYKFGRPFVTFIILAMLLVVLAEILHHLPGLSFLGAVSGRALTRQLPVLIAGAAIYIVGTIASLKASQKRFERIDL